MSRNIDMCINEYIFEGFFDNSVLPNFTTNPSETLELLYMLKDSTMKSYNTFNTGKEYIITNPVCDFPVSHPKLTVALCLMTLASSGVSEEEVRDLKWQYNFDNGYFDV